MSDQPIEASASEAQPTGQLVDMPDGSKAIMIIGPDGAASFAPVPTAAAPAPEPAPEPVAAAPAPEPAPEPVAAAPAPEPAPAAVPATVAPAPAPATRVENRRPVAADVEGLEGIDSSDLMMPTLKINHKENRLEDSLSGELFEKMDVVLLGMVKQRILWPGEVAEEASAPLCRSYDYHNGVPGEGFAVKVKGDPYSPLEKSGFTAEQVDGGFLTCAECVLKDWESHPKRDAPWCTEQWVFAAMLGEPDEPIGTPAMFTVQRSAMKEAKSYVTSFVRSRNPLFISRTTLTLDGRSRGSVSYSVPKFRKGVATDVAYHPEYAELFRQVRDYVTTPRVSEEETPVKVETKPAAAASVSDDDLPF